MMLCIFVKCEKVLTIFVIFLVSLVSPLQTCMKHRHDDNHTLPRDCVQKAPARSLREHSNYHTGLHVMINICDICVSNNCKNEISCKVDTCI